MIEEVINVASNLVNTPGLVMIGVGLCSAMVLRTIVGQANHSTGSLISYQTESDEFPLPVPAAIYQDGTSAKRKGKQLTATLKNTKNREARRNEEFSNPSAAPKEANHDHLTQDSVSSRDQSHKYRQDTVSKVQPIFEEPYRMNDSPSSDHLHKCGQGNVSKVQPIFEEPYRMSDSPSSHASGDNYLIVEPPEDRSDSHTCRCQTENTSFTGPLLASMDNDESTSQSITWTEGYIGREPFEFEEEKHDKKCKKTKSKNRQQQYN